jgi:hypothetical protein
MECEIIFVKTAVDQSLDDTLVRFLDVRDTKTVPTTEDIVTSGRDERNEPVRVRADKRDVRSA